MNAPLQYGQFSAAEVASLPDTQEFRDACAAYYHACLRSLGMTGTYVHTPVPGIPASLPALVPEAVPTRRSIPVRGSANTIRMRVRRALSEGPKTVEEIADYAGLTVLQAKGCVNNYRDVDFYRYARKWALCTQVEVAA